MGNVKLIRDNMRKQRDSLSREEILAKSSSIGSRLEDLIYNNSFDKILCFYPIRSEVDLLNTYSDLLDNGYNLYFPISLEKDLEFIKVDSMKDFRSGKYNIPEPIGNDKYNGEKALVICPGLAFDKKGNRYGYGGGYYDRFLRNNNHCTPVGVAYSFQLVDKLEAREWDYPLEMLITDEDTYTFNK